MQVTVIGAGSMGHGIAQVSAMSGHDVVLNDLDEKRVRAGLDGIESNLDGGGRPGAAQSAVGRPGGLWSARPAGRPLNRSASR